MFPLARGPLREAESEGSEGGGAPAFDPAKFRAEMLAEFNKGLNGALKNLRTELAPKKADPEGDPDPEPDPKPGEKVDPKVKALEKRLADMAVKFETESKARAEAERRGQEKELHSLVRSEISKFSYAKANGADTAFRLLVGDIKRTEDGSIETPDGSTLEEYVAAKLNGDYDNLLAAKDKGGAGAGTGRRSGAVSIQLEDIKPGMSADQKSSILAELARLSSSR